MSVTHLDVYKRQWHLEAGKFGLRGIERSMLPGPLKALRERWYLALPLAVLVFMLFHGFTPLFAGTIGLALTVGLLLGAGIAAGLGTQTLRVIFWVGLGLIAATLFREGMDIRIVAGLIAVLILANAFTLGGRATLAVSRDALAAVSYTHLDVYKRQPMHPCMRGSNSACCPSRMRMKRRDVRWWSRLGAPCRSPNASCSTNC